MKMGEQYWADVNRYCGEILTGLPFEYEHAPLLYQERSYYGWPAQEAGVNAALQEIQYRALGIISVGHNHSLGLTRDESGTPITRHIIFNPTRAVVKRVQNDIPPKTNSEYARSLWERYKVEVRVGVHLPTEEDYVLLHDELQRGARFRSYEV